MATEDRKKAINELAYAAELVRTARKLHDLHQDDESAQELANALENFKKVTEREAARAVPPAQSPATKRFVKRLFGGTH